MLRCVALIITDVLEERIASIIRVTRIGTLETLAVTATEACQMLWLPVTANVVPSSLILVTLMMEAICSSESWVFTRTHGVTSQKTAFLININ
jgi:hypothetical protein